MVMNNNYKYFSGQIKSEELAARIYDRYSLQTMGLRARTNFDYTLRELNQLIEDIDKYQISRIPIEKLIASGGEGLGADRCSILLKGTFIVKNPIREE
jgi:hypothetical protein